VAGSKSLNLVQRKPDKVVVLILSAPRLLAIKLVKNIGDKENKWHLRNQKKNPTFGNGDKRKATGQCRSDAQKRSSNSRKKK
jgi:hypothetical protein